MAADEPGENSAHRFALSIDKAIRKTYLGHAVPSPRTQIFAREGKVEEGVVVSAP
jgi:hypothetical protein